MSNTAMQSVSYGLKILIISKWSSKVNDTKQISLVLGLTI